MRFKTYRRTVGLLFQSMIQGTGLASLELAVPAYDIVRMLAGR